MKKSDRDKIKNLLIELLIKSFQRKNKNAKVDITYVDEYTDIFIQKQIR